MREGLALLPVSHQRVGQVVLHLGVERVELERLLELRDGLGQLTRLLEGVAEVVVGNGVARRELQRLAKGVGRFRRTSCFQ